MAELFKDVFPGIYEGIVEYINDPAQLGRIKVRVLCKDGFEKIKTESLPWASPCMPFGGGPGFGTITVPVEGSSVYVMFKQGDPNLPVYMGALYGNPGQEMKMLTNLAGDLPNEDNMSMVKKGEAWTAPPGPDMPREFLIQSNNRPERSVIFKTVKGASIDVNDRDQEERLAIHDRAGQALVFESNVSSENNNNNASARGLRSSIEGDSLPIKRTLTNEGSVDLVDIGGQSISLHTKQNNSRITITSKEPLDLESPAQKEIDGLSTVSLDLASGDKQITIEIRDNAKIKAKLVLDGNAGFLEIVAPLLTKINSDTIILTGNVTVDGNLTVTKNTYSLNDKIN